MNDPYWIRPGMQVSLQGTQGVWIVSSTEWNGRNPGYAVYITRLEDYGNMFARRIRVKQSDIQSILTWSRHGDD